MKILIAGAGGFIGGHLSTNLFDEGAEIVCADNAVLRAISCPDMAP